MQLLFLLTVSMLYFYHEVSSFDYFDNYYYPMRTIIYVVKPTLMFTATIHYSHNYVVTRTDPSEDKLQCFTICN